MALVRARLTGRHLEVADREVRGSVTLADQHPLRGAGGVVPFVRSDRNLVPLRPGQAAVPASTGRVTTDPAPTRASSPTRIGPRILAPAPTTTRLPTVGWRLAWLRLTPPSVTPW